MSTSKGTDGTLTCITGIGTFALKLQGNQTGRLSSPTFGALYACLKTYRPFIYRGAGRGETISGEVIEVAPEHIAVWWHPWPAHLEHMAEKFEKLAENQCNRVAFNAIRTIEDVCGTVACHAGWAGVVLNAGSYYAAGANALAQFLNAHWSEGEKFARWAHNNEQLWGPTAEYGAAGGSTASLMFSSGGYLAFGFTHPRLCTLKDIAKRYRQVAGRVKAAWPN